MCDLRNFCTKLQSDFVVDDVLHGLCYAPRMLALENNMSCWFSSDIFGSHLGQSGKVNFNLVVLITRNMLNELKWLTKF